MRKLLLAALLAGSVVQGAPSASACHFEHPANLECWDHSPPSAMSTSNGRSNTTSAGGDLRAPNYDWRGLGCSFYTLNDTTPGGQLGGNNVWNGTVTVAIRAVNNDAGPDPDGDGPLVGTPATPAPSASVSVSCDLSINGGTPTTTLTASGAGSANNADQIQFTASSGSVVVMCSNMVIGGESMQDCGTAEETPVCPDPLCGPGGSIEVIGDAVNVLFGSAVDLLDPAICPVLQSLAPAINSLGLPNVIYVGPDGDLHATGAVSDLVFGDPTDDLAWDCPPEEL